jgi:two-component sensor histidine kinase
MAEPDENDPSLALERQAARHREIEHRVKNTLQLISSIVLLQGRRAQDDSARQALKAIQQRVAAVSVAHRHVVWDAESEQVELAALVREIAGDLAGSAGRDGVSIDLDLETVKIPGRQGAPVALLVCEMLSNALRHAYPLGREGRVRVSVRRTLDGVELTVSDQGVGMDPEARATGFGMTVAQLMAQQMRARLQVDAEPPGLRLSVVLPREAAAP